MRFVPTSKTGRKTAEKIEEWVEANAEALRQAMEFCKKSSVRGTAPAMVAFKVYDEQSARLARSVYVEVYRDKAVAVEYRYHDSREAEERYVLGDVLVEGGRYVLKESPAVCLICGASLEPVRGGGSRGISRVCTNCGTTYSAHT